jgi:hypothetical protein
MKVRTLIAGAAVMFLCGGLGVCVAQDAPAPAASAAAPASEPAGKPQHHHGKHHHRHHQGKHHGQHGQQEFTEQELQAQTPSK